MGKLFEIVITKSYIYNINTHKLLVVKRSLDDSRPGVWENPGGTALNGENPDDCILREIMEETGLVVKSIKFLYDDRIKNTNIVFKNYFSYVDIEDIYLSAEHTEYRWLDLDEYLKIVDPTIKDNFNKYKVIYNLN